MFSATTEGENILFNLKKLILFSGLLVFTSMSIAEIKVGECLANPATKVYILNNFSQNYPKTVIFSCQYNCLSKSGTTTIKAISNVRVNSISEDAQKVVCEGVQVQKKSWGYDFDKTLPIYSYKSKTSEIKKWAYNNISLESQLSLTHLNQLKKSLTHVGNIYFSVSTQDNKPINIAFRDAGIRILAIASELPHSFKSIENESALMQSLEDKKPIEGSADQLVFGVLQTTGSWLINDIN